MLLQKFSPATITYTTVVFINDIEVNHNMSMIYIMKYFTIVFVKTISHFISNHYLLNDMLKTWSERD